LPKHVTVIGGGPAGLRAAKLLSEKGIETTLYEAGETGHPVRCGEVYQDVYPNVCKPRHGHLFEYKEANHVINGEIISIDGSNMHQYDKKEMMKGMKDEAEDAGVEVIENKTVKHVPNASVTVDASGYPSLIYPHTAYDAGFAVSHRVNKEVDEMKFVWEEDGYCWEFPKCGESNVGYGTFDREAFGEVGDKAKEEAESVGKTISVGGGYVPTNLAGKLCVPEKRTILIGDAAGLCNEFHGGGVHTALLSAEIASEAIVNGNMGVYEAKLASLLEREARTSKIMKEFLNQGKLKELMAIGGNVEDLTNPGIVKRMHIGIKVLKNRIKSKMASII